MYAKTTKTPTSSFRDTAPLPVGYRQPNPTIRERTLSGGEQFRRRVMGQPENVGKLLSAKAISGHLPDSIVAG
jgi:hypothetical protein